MLPPTNPVRRDKRWFAPSRVAGGAIAGFGFLLSPLSWWNDLIINIPLAYLFAIPITWISPNLFAAAFIVGYLLTNVLGFILLHHGLKQALNTIHARDFKRELKKDLIWSGLYTILIVVLIPMGWIKPPQAYLGGG